MTSEKTFPNCIRQSLAFLLSTNFLLMIFSTSLFNYFPWQMIFQAAVYLLLSSMISNLCHIPTWVSCQQHTLRYSDQCLSGFFLLLYLFLFLARLLTIHLNGTMESYMTFFFPLLPMPYNQIEQLLPVHFNVPVSSFVSLASSFL